MPIATRTILIDGPVGPIETLVDVPDGYRGLALVAHPHPLLGGTNNNKVAYTLAHGLRDLGYLTLRPNFRGVGKTAGTHDQGQGETEDLLAVLDHATSEFANGHSLPIVLAGFSFGAFVQTRVSRRLAQRGRPASHLVLAGLATGRPGDSWPYTPEPAPANTILIHGERDLTVPLGNVTAYAEPLGLTVKVIPGADHFFHGRLQLIRDILREHVQSP